MLSVRECTFGMGSNSQPAAAVAPAAIHAATLAVRGKAEPFSLTGSLPIIHDLQEAGYDVQITGTAAAHDRTPAH
jgi:hypothetical protein